MALRFGAATETIEGVVVIDRRDSSAREKSVMCRFPDGKKRFVARSQVPEHQEFPDDGSEFELEVSVWMLTQWDLADRGPRPVAKLADVVVLRDFEGKFGPCLRVRLADGTEHWVGKDGIDEDSPVQGDGDRGELWVQPWVAKKIARTSSTKAEEGEAGGVVGHPDPGTVGYGDTRRDPPGYEPGPGRAEPGIAADARTTPFDDDEKIPF